MGATLDEKKRLPGLEFVVREGELIVSLIFALNRRQAQRRVCLQ
ncbi:MAG: hypothetical protein ACXWZD_06290 [Actinomycetota bacterium]